jgi:Domain of unknown function (DUF222)/HNH endonuclease
MFGSDHRLQAIASALDELAAEDLSGSCGPARSEGLAGLLATAERMNAEIIRRAGPWERSGEWALDGALTPASWLRAHAGLEPNEATELVRTARLVHDHEPTGDALRSGAVSTRKLHQIARTVKDREPAYRENPDVLLDAAAALPPAAFSAVTRRWRQAADDQLARAEAHEQYERRYLHASVTLAGMVALDGLLDPEGGAVFLAALDTRDQPDPQGGPEPARSGSQRRADALVALASESLDREVRGGRAPVTVDVVIDVGTLAGGTPLPLTSVRHDLERVGPVPRTTAERLACDCAIGRVVLRGESEVLDLGRRTRLVSAAQRRALVHRDRRCAFPGCDRPPRWCDAHHLVPWQRGGPTDLDNLVLLCRRHHVLCHEGGWRLARGPDRQVTATRPSHPPDRDPDHDPDPPRPRPPDRTDFILAA